MSREIARRTRTKRVMRGHSTAVQSRVDDALARWQEDGVIGFAGDAAAWDALRQMGPSHARSSAGSKAR